MIERTCKAMSGGETFTFRAETIEELVVMVAEEAKNRNSCFSYIDAAAMFHEDMIKELMDKTDEVAKKQVEKIKTMATEANS